MLGCDFDGSDFYRLARCLEPRRFSQLGKILKCGFLATEAGGNHGTLCVGLAYVAIDKDSFLVVLCIQVTTRLPDGNKRCAECAHFIVGELVELGDAGHRFDGGEGLGGNARGLAVEHGDGLDGGCGVDGERGAVGRAGGRRLGAVGRVVNRCAFGGRDGHLGAAHEVGVARNFRRGQLVGHHLAVELDGFLAACVAGKARAAGVILDNTIIVVGGPNLGIVAVEGHLPGRAGFVGVQRVTAGPCQQAAAGVECPGIGLAAQSHGHHLFMSDCGFTIITQVVQCHAGTIRVDSAHGHGSALIHEDELAAQVGTADAGHAGVFFAFKGLDCVSGGGHGAQCIFCVAKVVGCGLDGDIAFDGDGGGVGAAC